MNLPPLPEGDTFTADDMRAYGVACIESQAEQDADIATIEAAIRSEMEAEPNDEKKG